VGGLPGTIVACDSTSVNLFKAANSAIADAVGPPVLLTDSGNFPSDIYILGTVAKRHGWELRIVDPEEVADSVGSGVGVLALTQVDYRSGRRHGMAGVTALARNSDVVTLWDLAHSAGAFAVDLESAGADYAVGCGYKYLNGGPGAPAFIYVAPHRQENMGNPITGWFGHAAPFDFDLSFVPAEGIDRMRVGTSHVLSLSVMEAAMGVFEEVDMAAVWSRGERLVTHLCDGFEELGLEVITPRDPRERGSQVSFRHPQAYAIVQGLIEHGVIGDFRAPDIARFGVAPLYVEHADVATALARLSDLLSDQDLDRFSARRGAVT
jgi:kynureninase